MSDVQNGPHETNGTRDELLRALRDRRAATVAQLAEVVGRTRACVHNHLIKMLDQGLVGRSGNVRLGRGRPGYRYELTPAGEACLPKDYAGLACGALTAVRRCFGRQGLMKVLEERNRSLLAEWPVGGRRLGDRLREHVVHLSAAGYEACAEDGELTLGNCPYPEAARLHPEVCLAESRLHEAVLGVRVRRVGRRLVDGGSCCRYRLDCARQ